MQNKDLNFECIGDFADELVGNVMRDDEMFVSVVGKFDHIRLLLLELMRWEKAWFDGLDLQSPEYNGYEDEYILSLWYTDGCLQIGCEPAMRDGTYLYFEGDDIYIFDDCNSKVLRKCSSDNVYFVSFDDECLSCDFNPNECLCECDDCCAHDDEDFEVEDDMHGFTATKNDDNGYYSVSYYTSEELDKREIKSLLKRFGF